VGERWVWVFGGGHQMINATWAFGCVSWLPAAYRHTHAHIYTHTHTHTHTHAHTHTHTHSIVKRNKVLENRVLLVSSRTTFFKQKNMNVLANMIMQ